MQRVSELIQEYCPNGVEFKKLGEIVTIKTGKTVNKDYIAQNPGKYPVINSGVEPLGYVNTYNTVDDELGVTSRGAGVGTVLWTEGKYFRGGLNYGLTPKTEVGINKRFLYHVLLHSKHAIDALCVFSGIPALNASNLERLEIPLPPLPVQEEIVRILDTFTELIAELKAELKAELTARKKQYEFYRDELLKLEGVEGVAYRRLGEVCLFERGKAITKKQVAEGKIPVISGGQEPAYYHNKHNRKGTTIVIAGSGAYAGYVSFWQIPVFVSDAFTVKPKKDVELNIKYLYYFLKAQQEVIYGMQKGVGVPHVYGTDVARLQIPIPSLAEQERIVSILDQFDTLINSLTEGIPAEIELRQKQYEFYREKLLTF